MNPRFSDYVTSGAFNLTLTRNQVISIGTLHGGVRFVANAAALERKGLVELIPAPDRWEETKVEFRLTHAGLLCAAMLSEAGLANGFTPKDPIAFELEQQRAEMVRARQEASEARQTARSALARKEEAEAELEDAQRQLRELRTGQREKLNLRFVRTRDPLPDLTDAAIARRAEEPAMADPVRNMALGGGNTVSVTHHTNTGIDHGAGPGRIYVRGRWTFEEFVAEAQRLIEARRSSGLAE